MRTIKFRGKDISGKWHVGNLSVIDSDLSRVKAGTYISNSAGMPFAYMVDPDTIGQFTGIRDKNNKEIYEGDIVRSEYTGDEVEIKFGQYSESTDDDVINGNGFYWGECNYEMGFSLDYEGGTSKYEIIGTVHDKQ